MIAEKCGISVPADTRVLIAPLDGVGRDYPLSIEKLCPVLSFYVVRDWREGCERCKQILRYGGMGHTMSIHSQNDQVILEFGLKKPAFRIVVNSPTTLGSIGLTTGLDPAMTLGCGGYGGNITSDNISPRHLLNIKRLAYEIAPAAARLRESAPAAVGDRRPGRDPRRRADLANRPVPGRAGYRAELAGPSASPSWTAPGGGLRLRLDAGAAPLDFVCEDDVRKALQAGRQLVVAERAIVTPAARELGEHHRVFVAPPWRGRRSSSSGATWSGLNCSFLLNLLDLVDQPQRLDDRMPQPYARA